MSYGQGDSYRPVPRDFTSLIQTCTSNIQKITQNTAQIKNMVSQLGTRQDNSELQDRLQQIQHYTNQLAKETNKHLKELGSVPLPASPSEQRQQKIQRERLMNEFSAALNNFQAVQRRTAEKEKESVARARAGSRLSADDSLRDEKLVSFDNQDDWGQMTTQTEEAAITEEDLELIKERETNIRQLESDILDVNQIFKDLAVMIHDQGEMIDSIEANVENAEVHVERGAEQLQRASYYQGAAMLAISVPLSIEKYAATNAQPPNASDDALKNPLGARAGCFNSGPVGNPARCSNLPFWKFRVQQKQNHANNQDWRAQNGAFLSKSPGRRCASWR